MNEGHPSAGLAGQAAVHLLVLPRASHQNGQANDDFRYGLRSLRAVWAEVTGRASEPLARQRAHVALPSEEKLLRLGSGPAVAPASHADVLAYWDGHYHTTPPSGAAESISYLFAEHDAICLLTVRILPPAVTDPDGWRNLQDEWQQWMAVLVSRPSVWTPRSGSAYLGLTGELSRASSTVGEAVKVFARTGAWCSQPGLLAQGRIIVWRVEHRLGESRQLNFVAVAAMEDEHRLDDWSWNLDQAGETWLTAYLVEAAKLDYTVANFLAMFERAREDRDNLRLASDRLLGEVATTTSGSSDRRVAAEVRRGVLAADAAGDPIADQVADLCHLHVTASIASANLRRLVANVELEARASDPFNPELRLADWLDLQVASERDYSQAALERTQYAVVRARTYLESIRTEAATRQADAVAIFGVLTTTLLATLTAITVLPEAERRNTTLLLALAAAVAAITFYVGLAAVHFWRRYRRWEYVVAGMAGLLTGYSIAWLVGIGSTAIGALTAIGSSLLAVALFGSIDALYRDSQSD